MNDRVSAWLGLSEGLLTQILDHLPVGVGAVGPDLRTFVLNQAARRLLALPGELFAAGLPPFAEIVRYNARRGEYGPGDPEVLTAQIVERAQKMEPHHVCRTRPDGTVLDIRGEPLPGGGFVTIWTDITALKQAECEALERAQELRLVTDNVPGIIAFIDTEMRYRFVNRQLAKLLGHEDGRRIVGRTVREVVGDDVHADLREPIARALAGDRAVYQRAFRAADGEAGSLQITLVPYKSEDGRVIGVYALGSDVTALVRAEQDSQQRNRELQTLNANLAAAQAQLLQSEKMASIGQLAAGVAHEINNPVGYVISNFTSLKGYVTDLLRVIAAYEAIEPLLPAGDPRVDALRGAKEGADLEFVKDDVQQLLSESGDGLSRVRKIVQDLKDFSHVDARQEWAWVDLHAGLDSTLNIVNNEIKYKADVVKEYGQLPDVQCLPSELNQVFMNLLVNAAHAITAERGTITIRTGCEGEQVWVEVIDDGCGIAQENLTRIFDPFFTTKPVGKGTGLGLSLSYGIVKKHDGRIDVKSGPGVGTTFRVSLPVHRAEQ